MIAGGTNPFSELQSYRIRQADANAAAAQQADQFNTSLQARADENAQRVAENNRNQALGWLQYLIGTRRQQETDKQALAQNAWARANAGVEQTFREKALAQQMDIAKLNQGLHTTQEKRGKMAELTALAKEGADPNEILQLGADMELDPAFVRAVAERAQAPAQQRLDLAKLSADMAKQVGAFKETQPVRQSLLDDFGLIGTVGKDDVPSFDPMKLTKLREEDPTAFAALLKRRNQKDPFVDRWWPRSNVVKPDLFNAMVAALQETRKKAPDARAIENLRRRGDFTRLVSESDTGAEPAISVPEGPWFSERWTAMNAAKPEVDKTPVRVTSPKGQTGTVPKRLLPQALNAGYTLIP